MSRLSRKAKSAIDTNFSAISDALPIIDLPAAADCSVPQGAEQAAVDMDMTEHRLLPEVLEIFRETAPSNDAAKPTAIDGIIALPLYIASRPFVWAKKVFIDVPRVLIAHARREKTFEAAAQIAKSKIYISSTHKNLNADVAAAKACKAQTNAQKGDGHHER